MIDNYEDTMALIKKMEEYLPISAEPTKNFIHAMRKNGIKVKSNQKLQIESVVYLGDEGGVGCCVGLLKKGEVVVTSLTHIRVKNAHTIGKDLKKIPKNAYGCFSFTKYEPRVFKIKNKDIRNIFRMLFDARNGF